MGFLSVPSTAATAALALQGAGAASGAVGSYFSAENQRTNLDTQANIADLNAQLSEQSAQAALRAGQRQQQSVRLRTAQLKSNQRAALAANGVDLGSPSAVNLLTSTDTLGTIDADTVNANAVRTGFGYRTQGANYQNQALTARATAAGISPGLNAATTLLTGAGSVASSWYRLNKAGAFSDDPLGDFGREKGFW